jgi:uncharacterized membrane protein YbhN (UPF0104 family)
MIGKSAVSIETIAVMRSLAFIAVKLAISALLIYLATRRINIEVISERLSRLNYGWLAAAVAVALLQAFLLAIRWQRIVLMCGAVLSSRRAIRFAMIGAFFSQVLPSTVGGDAARILLLARSSAGWRIAAYSVLLDRFVGVLVLALLVVAGLYWSFCLIANPLGRLALLSVGFGSLAGGAVFLMAGSWPRLLRWTTTRPLFELSLLGRQILLSHNGSPMILVVSLLIHLLTALCAWSIAHGVAAQLEYFDALLLVLPVMLIATIPISIAGWGVRESALVLAFTYAGLAGEDGLAVSVLLGFAQFAIGLIGGVVWLANSEGLRIADAFKSEHAKP